MEKVEKIWFDGEFISWDDAQVHVLTHTLHYGLGVFEGIRCYRCDSGRTAVFRLREHVERLFNSAKVVDLKIPYSLGEIEDAILETIKVNGLEEGYIRPLVFIGDGAMGLYGYENPVHTVIAVWPWGAYLGEEGLEKGIRVKISSYTRHHVNTAMTKAKVCGYYVNSILAKKEAKDHGYDEALLLDTEGYVAEGSGENIFIVRHGELKTPPLTSILEGITRDTVIRIARHLQIPVREERFTRDELYMADEAFLTGTAAEITPIREVDGKVIGEGRRGEVTALIQREFFDIVKGRKPLFEEWLTYVGEVRCETGSG